MNKRIIRNSLIVAAISAILFFILKGRAPFGKDNSSFGVDPDIKITRLELIRKDKKVSIEESGGEWFINKEEVARKSAVFFILRTIREMRIKSPVSSELFDNEIVRKQIEPVRVNVYSKRRLIRSFYVYRTLSNVYGNIMKMKASSKPFIVYLPGYEDNIGIHFVPDELFWKPYIVFHLLPSEIASVRHEIISDSSSSFVVRCSNGTFSLSDLKKEVAGWDTSKVKRYLTYFTSIAFENWAFDLSVKDRKNIESGPPLYRITVRQSDGKEIILTVWERWMYENEIRKPDTDRVWAKTNQRDEIFIMKYPDLDPVLKRISYFFK
jgi:hypothetical protein